MAHSVNLVCLTGRIGRKPDLRELDSSGAVEVSMLVLTVYRYKKGDEWMQETERNRVEVFGTRRGIGWLSDLQEGDKVSLTGRLKHRRYEKDGERHDVIVIQCRGSQFHGVVSGKPREAQQRHNRPTSSSESGEEADPIPA